VFLTFLVQIKNSFENRTGALSYVVVIAAPSPSNVDVG
jgi:hypothetical protein